MAAGFTVGVEEEYQLVEPETGELRSHASRVRAHDLTGEISGEIQETMLEIGTPVCTTLEEVRDSLRQRRFQASTVAAAESLEILSAGLHPFSGWEGHSLSDADRPQMLLGFFGQLLRQQQICGLHVHIAIPEGFDRVRLMNVVRVYMPHLPALSCSSPLMFGRDTRFASFRGVLWRAFPFSGVPPRFESDREFTDFVDMLRRGGIIPDDRTLYWSVRPSPRYPTLEVRVCDASPRIADAVALAGLARAIVVAAAEDVLPEMGRSLSPSLQNELLAENEWVAARDGLNAALADPESPGGRTPIRSAIERLLELVAPVCRSLGDHESIPGIERILEQGNAADRIRRRISDGETLPDLARWLVEETRAGTGIDRRMQSRPTEAGGGGG